MQADDSEDGASADISRKHLVRRTDRLITVTGGKLTTFRRMAQDVVDLLSESPCRTRDVALVGAGPTEDRPDVPTVLWRRYGNEAPVVWDLGETRPELREPIVAGSTHYGVEAEFGIAAELALTVGDVVERRTRIGVVSAAREPAMTAVAQQFGDRLAAADLSVPA